MVVFWKLILGHLIADFALQTNQIASWKRESQWGMALHVVCHPVAYVALTWDYLSWPWVQAMGYTLNGWTCVALITVLHLIEDEWRVWAIHRGTRDSTMFLVWDQLVHLGVILAFAPIIPGTRAEPWVLFAIALVVLSHLTSVVIFFVENDLGMNSTVLEKGKYGYMLERLVGAALFLLPGVWFLLTFAWIGWLMFQHFRRTPDRTWVHLLIGNMSVLLTGLALRGVIR